MMILLHIQKAVPSSETESCNSTNPVNRFRISFGREEGVGKGRLERKTQSNVVFFANSVQDSFELAQSIYLDPATLCSRLESLNIREKGLICSLRNLSPLRKSMVCSIRLLISSGPDWTCKACARWFGSRFIEFLVKAARV